MTFCINANGFENKFFCSSIYRNVVKPGGTSDIIEPLQGFLRLMSTAFLWRDIMLNIYLGELDQAIYYSPAYFDNQCEDEWITDKLSIEVIKDVDKSEVISARLIDSPVLGPVSVKELSGGVKTLMLLAFDQSGKIFNASACGDNCAKWILKTGKDKDLTINLRHLMDFGEGEFTIKIVNTGDMVHNMEEFIEIAGNYL